MLEGILIFQKANQGSHSQGVFPYLYRGYGQFVKVAHVDDIPFMNPILSRYDGKAVALEGEFDLNEVFVATSVTVLETVELISPPEEEAMDDLTIVLPVDSVEVHAENTVKAQAEDPVEDTLAAKVTHCAANSVAHTVEDLESPGSEDVILSSDEQ